MYFPQGDFDNYLTQITALEAKNANELHGMEDINQNKSMYVQIRPTYKLLTSSAFVFA